MWHFYGEEALKVLTYQMELQISVTELLLIVIIYQKYLYQQT